MQRLVLQFGRSAGIYASMAAVGFACSLLTFAVYAAWLTPRSFGFVTTIRVITALAQTFSSGGMVGGMFRFLSEESGKRHSEAGRSILWTGFISALTCATFVAIVLAFGALLILPRTLGASWVLGMQLEAGALVCAAVYEVSIHVARALNQAASYVALYVTNSSVSVALTVVLLVFFRLDAYGVFWADLISSLTLVPLCFWLIARDGQQPRFSRPDLRRIARFGLPIVPAQLGEWVLTFSDRLFLQALTGPTQLGVYSLGYRLGQVEQQLAIGGLQLAWDPFVLTNMHESSSRSLFGVTATYMLAAAMIPVILLGALAPTLLTIVHARAGYSQTSPVVFLIALASWFGFARYIFVTPTSISLRPEWGVFVVLITAAVNLGLNLPLIRAFGMMGAAWSTLIAYAAGAFTALLVGRRLWKIDFEYYRLVVIAAAAVAVYFGSQTTHLPSLWAEFVFKTVGSLTAFVVLLTAFGFWRSQERELARLSVLRLTRSSRGRR
jgi:O-antigen/teichoic acid export membrane protein